MVVGVRTEADRLAVEQFVGWLGTVPYPPPLKLNLEPFGGQEFLETAVTGGDRVSLVMLTKRLAARRDERLLHSTAVALMMMMRSPSVYVHHSQVSICSLCV